MPEPDDQARIGEVLNASEQLEERRAFPWVETVPDDEWTDGPLAELYGRVVDAAAGRVDHIMSVHSLNPTGLAAHDGLYRSAMTGTASLRKVERELIALVVSLENHCHY